MTILPAACRLIDMNSANEGRIIGSQVVAGEAVFTVESFEDSCRDCIKGRGYPLSYRVLVNGRPCAYCPTRKMALAFIARHSVAS